VETLSPPVLLIFEEAQKDYELGKEKVK